MRKSDQLLFSDKELRGFLRDREQEMFTEIDRIAGNTLLNTNVDDLCDYLQQKYCLDLPRLKTDEINIDQQEAQIDVSRDWSRGIDDSTRPHYITGTAILFFIPFDGDSLLFRHRPSRFTLNPPRATIEERAAEVRLQYEQTNHDAKAVKTQFDRDLSAIQNWLQSVEDDIAPFNRAIPEKARHRIEQRREKLLKDQNLVASIGYPLRKRSDAPQTYVVPTVRRKIAVFPSSSTESFTPEPTLDIGEYEHILSVITNMVMVIERSPQAFIHMKEEDMRQQFLVQLNGQYEGQATGETFNFNGKTDILIRAEERNIFIAECKYWQGPKSLHSALDQLLGYASWRDTKTAILLFNRNKNLSSVLSQIPDVVAAHPNYKRSVSYQSETGFRFVLHHQDDMSRDILLTILVFEVPA